MNTEISFWIKVVRNAFILAGLYFVSVYAVGELSYQVLKPVIIFFMGYIFTELARHYGLQIPKSKKGETLIFM